MVKPKTRPDLFDVGVVVDDDESVESVANDTDETDGLLV
jgi:hypothetical protein